MSQQRLRYKWQRVQTKSRLIFSGGHVFKFHPAPNFNLSLFGPNSLSRTNAQVYVGLHGTASITNYCLSRCSGARFSKVSNLFGHISGDLILFLSSKGRRLEVRNFAVILSFISIWKDQLDGVSGSQFNEWPKNFRDFRDASPRYFSCDSCKLEEVGIMYHARITVMLRHILRIVTYFTKWVILRRVPRRTLTFVSKIVSNLGLLPKRGFKSTLPASNWFSVRALVWLT